MVLATVVREAVTNILRHSAALHCTITLAIVDDGCACGSATTAWSRTCRARAGHGLVNLRARVEVVAGRFTARRLGREFEVVAELPFQRQARMPRIFSCPTRDARASGPAGGMYKVFDTRIGEFVWSRGHTVRGERGGREHPLAGRPA